MKIKVKNLGALKQAEFELGKITIICGENNTGKTYATYALFGFLSFWREAFAMVIPDQVVTSLLTEGTTHLDIHQYIQKADQILDEGCIVYTKQLPSYFASSEKNFETSEFHIKLDSHDIQPLDTFSRNIGSAKTQIFSIMKQSNESTISITLLTEKETVKIPKQIIKRAIGDAVKEIIFGHLFPRAFIASAERTGAAIFRKELNFARNRLLEQISNAENDVNPFDLVNRIYSDYALPVKRNVDFARQLEDIAKRDSFITKEYQNVLDDFSSIIGGAYNVTKNNELYFIPHTNKRLKLTMDASSSAVRSLLDVGFYLRHEAQKGDLLMVDEPELNLHPENQRRVARLFSRLIRLGIKVFITTNSDYIIKELSTLIMLNHDRPHLKAIMRKEGYKTEELLSANDVRVYIAEEKPILLNGNQRRTTCHTLVPAEIDAELGIEARSFDATIEQMNSIHEYILFGGNNNG
ncbi:MAG: hypothetical protein C4527_17195 [Candidatus Omnitrophota bacterium]|nr:MAG: hypothetical protein C4527_17195 [Candidatus Omnitrophota bacterium]